MKNKKLVKQVAVASLAALMMIPNLTMTSYAGPAEDSLNKNIKHAQEMVEKFKKEGNEEGVKNWANNLNKWLEQKNSGEYKQKDAEWQATKDRIAANKAKEAAAQAEKERIANTVYSLDVRYVKDFISYVKSHPDLNDHQYHKYERTDMPGIIFTLRVDPWDKVYETNSNITILEEYDADYLADVNFEGTKYQLVKGQGLKVKYICPFECIASVVNGGMYTGADYHYDNFKNERYRDGDDYTTLGENIIYVVRRYQMLYDKGYPAELQGQLVITDGRAAINKPKLTVEQIYNDLRTGTNGFSTSNKEKHLSTKATELTIDFSK